VAAPTSPWRWSLGAQACVAQAAWVGVRLMVGYRALHLGADGFLMGALASSFALPALFGALPAGRWSDRIGGSVVALAGLVVATAGTVGACLASTMGMLLAAAGLIGLGQIVVMVGQQTFVARVGVHRDAAFGTLTAASSIGQLIGPPLVTTLASLPEVGGAAAPNTTVGLVACAVLTAIGAPAYLGLRRSEAHVAAAPHGEQSRVPVTDLVKTPQMWRALAVSGAVLVSLDLMYAFFPVWAAEQGVSATGVGLLLALRAVVTVVSRTGLTRLVQRFGRKILILGSIATAVAGLIALPVVGLPGAVAVMVALGIGLGVPQPLTMTWVTALAPAEAHGAALGMRLTSNRIAQITLPLAVGALAGPFGVAGIFWANAAVLVAAMTAMARSDP
jgi:MFS family permease